MTQYLLIIYLIAGSSNLVYELSGQYAGLGACQIAMSQRVAAAKFARPGDTFTGQCLEMAK